MGVEYLQSNLTAGELAPTLHSRVDVAKYNNGVATAQNMVIMPHGGMRRRPGLSKIIDSYCADLGRIEPFVFNTEQGYIIYFRPGWIDVYRDGIKVASDIMSPYTTMTIIDEIDVIQSGDTMIVTHETVQPYRLLRMGSDSSWSFSPITFVAIPQFDFGSGTEDAWSASRGWPAVCTFFQGRLWMAGSTERPNTIWGSKVGGFFDFGLGTGAADDGLDDTLDTDQYNKITNIFAGRDLQVFTTGGEFYNNAPIITPTESGWVSQTGYGSKRIRPILIDGATLFVDSSERTLRQYIYNFNEDSYVSINQTLLSSHIVTGIRDIAAIKGTQYDVSDFVYVINEDGTCAVLNTMRLEEISGWTHWTTQGEFVNVAVVNKEVYFLVKRNNSFFIEKLQEGTYTDHNVLVDIPIPTTDSVVHLGDDVVHSTVSVVHTIDPATPVTSITTDYHVSFVNTDFKVIADYSIMPDAKYTGTGGSNSFTITRDAYRLEVGLNYETLVRTLPVSNETQKGVTLHRRKRIVKVDINVLESLGVYARSRYTSDREFTVVLDSAPVPFTGFKEMYLLGYDRLVDVDIRQEQPLPFTLRSIGTEIAY